MALPESRRLGRALPGEDRDEGRDLRRRRGRLECERLVVAPGRRPDRQGKESTTEREVTEAWTGPQVAWSMAHGGQGAFGRKINEPWIWLTLCAVFLLGLADFPPVALRAQPRPPRAPLLQRVALLLQPRPGVRRDAARLPRRSSTCSRMVWIGRHGRGSATRRLARVGAPRRDGLPRRLQIGLNVAQDLRASNVIDVGLAGVPGRAAHR